MRRLSMLFAALLFSGCAAIPLPAACIRPESGPAVWIVDRGWHTELFIPADAIAGPLASATSRFPGAPFIALGFGKRDWIIAEEQDIATILAAPIPGPGIVEITGQPRLPGQAIRLALDAPGMAGLQRFLAASLADPAAPPAVTSRFGQHFHTARQRYSVAFTCNSWMAEALAAAGLPVRPRGVVLARDVLRQAAALPRACAV